MNDKSNDSETIHAHTMAGDLRVLMSRLRRRTREARPGGFTASQLLALSHLERQGPATVTELAKAEGIRPQSMGANVMALEAAGLVSRTADPTDGRQFILSLTPKAVEFVKNYRAAREDWLFHSIQNKLSKNEQTDLAKFLKLIRRLIDE